MHFETLTCFCQLKQAEKTTCDGVDKTASTHGHTHSHTAKRISAHMLWTFGRKTYARTGGGLQRTHRGHDLWEESGYRS